MNTKFPLLTILTLALLAPSRAPAQAKDEAKSPVLVGWGRQIISNKLERFRLESVSYDGLPLQEVVRQLRDEARKRDPEKKGINFMVNPNPPAESSQVTVQAVDPNTGLPRPATPPEAVDINSISVRIDPPLIDVRLLDVLNAVVKVAERPIQFSLEDYGVVFSLQSREPARKAEIGFAFPGGTPNDFLNAVQQHYKVDWLSVADIPKQMADVRIPRLRITPESLASILPRTGGENGSLGALVSLYNQLGEQKSELGRLVVKGDPTQPSVVMFVPDKTLANAQPKMKVKAFSIYDINGEERVRLLEDIERAKKEATDYAVHVQGASGLRSLQGAVAIHNATRLLVATGSESFVEMVESIVNACMAKERARNPGAPTALPNVPGK